MTLCIQPNVLVQTHGAAGAQCSRVPWTQANSEGPCGLPFSGCGAEAWSAAWVGLVAAPQSLFWKTVAHQLGETSPQPGPVPRSPQKVPGNGRLVPSSCRRWEVGGALCPPKPDSVIAAVTSALSQAPLGAAESWGPGQLPEHSATPASGAADGEGAGSQTAPFPSGAKG